MNEQFSKEALMKLIDNVNISRAERNILFFTTSIWEHELSLHPERFRMEDDELLWWGSRVGVVASEREEKKFWRMVNQLIADGIVYIEDNKNE